MRTLTYIETHIFPKISRSKWTIDVKDLRLSDTGNYTCQVFNAYGFINATYDLTVYEDSRESLEQTSPLNATIMAGMSAELSCRVKSLTKPSIKWMKQISKSEYANYIVQNSANSENLSVELANIGKQLSASSQDSKLKFPSVDAIDEDVLKSFYAASTLSPLAIVEKPRRADDHVADFDETLLLSDLMSQELGAKSSVNDEFNFELLVPNEKSAGRVLRKTKNTARLSTGTGDESVHYITLSSSPLITEQLIKEQGNYYLSKLTIRQASVKDSGVYVCFGDVADAYTHRKSYLKVLPSKNRVIEQAASSPNSLNYFLDYPRHG